jgi:hypothetical protein
MERRGCLEKLAVPYLGEKFLTVYQLLVFIIFLKSTPLGSTVSQFNLAHTFTPYFSVNVLSFISRSPN